MNENLVGSRIANIVFLACLLFASCGAHAIVISYTAIDQPDTILGEDLWKYQYQVTDASFAGGEGFSIFFDPTLYATVGSNPPFVNGDWDILTTQPSTALPAPGVYDALALVNSPSLADSFQVNFTWLGMGLPGSQGFIQYDAGFTTTFIGTTVPSVPEPSRLSLMLVSLGVLGLVSRYRRLAVHREC